MSGIHRLGPRSGSTDGIHRGLAETSGGSTSISIKPVVTEAISAFQEVLSLGRTHKMAQREGYNVTMCYYDTNNTKNSNMLLLVC